MPAETRDATADLWARLARPFDPILTAEAVLGLPADVVRELAAVLVATCDEAEALVAAMPATLRQLKSAIGAANERCLGELRGPVQWSETVAAQASSMGNTDVFVCAAPHRAYDIDENRVLVAALQVLAGAGFTTDEAGDVSTPDESHERARDNVKHARRYLEHPALSQVRVDGRPTARALKRTRTSKSNRMYRPALAMLGRAEEPLTLEELSPYCDRRTRAQHGVLVAVIEELERRGMRVPAPRAESGSLFAGPVEFRHPRQRGDRTHRHGIVVGDLLVDVPERPRETNREVAQRELEARAQGSVCTVVMDTTEVPGVVDRAIAMARGG